MLKYFILPFFFIHFYFFSFSFLVLATACSRNIRRVHDNSFYVALLLKENTVSSWFSWRTSCPWGFTVNLIRTQALMYMEISFFQDELVHQDCFMLAFQNQNLSACLFINRIRIASQIQNVYLRNPDWIGQINVWGKILSNTVAL